MTPRIVLLDLNYTLCEAAYGSREAVLPMAQRLRQEQYRLWLVEALRGRVVLLVTARPARWAEATLARIAAACDGWQPDEAHFNDRNLPPPSAKETALLGSIFPRHGSDPARFLALESNPRTRAMYARHGIAAVPASQAAEALKEG